MSPWELMTKFKGLCAKLAEEGLTDHEAELSQLIAVLGAIIESHNHDILGLKSAVARLEHVVRHPAAPH
jgi:hypothetical protein